MARTLWIALFVAMAAENLGEAPFEGRWETPFRPLGDLLYRATPVKAPGIALLILVLLAVARRKPGAQHGRVVMLDRALWLNHASLLLMFVWGMAMGGALLQALLQIQVMLLFPFCAFLFTAGLQTEEDFRGAGKAIVLAGLYRAAVGWYYGRVVAPELGVTPAMVTTHADTVLFSTGIVILLAWALEERSRAAFARAAVPVSALLFAVHLNNRRLAYVCIGGSLLVLYALLERPLKRKLHRAMLLMTPLLALYLAAGWNSTSTVFKPVRAVSSMVGKTADVSSQTRDVENYNLMVTLRGNVVAGSGWGHEYEERSVAYSVAEVFPYYRYVPHNAVLGLWAFTGYLGSTAWWLCLVVSAFLSMRAHAFAETPLQRTICAVASCEVVIYAMQGYGDMGLSAWNGNLLMGVAFAAASRMAVQTGAYPERTVRAVLASEPELDGARA